VRCAVGLYTALYSSRILPLLVCTPACGNSIVNALIGRSVCTWLMQTLQQVLPTKQHAVVLCHVQVDSTASYGVLEQVDGPIFKWYCVCLLCTWTVHIWTKN